MSESTKFGMTTVKSAMRRAEKPAPFPQRGPKPPYELVRSFMPRPLRLIARVLDQHLDRSALQSAECDRARKHLLLALSGLIGVTALLIAGFSYRLPAAGLWLLAIMFVANVRLLLRAKTVGADGVKRDTRAGALALWCLLALGGWLSNGWLSPASPWILFFASIVFCQFQGGDRRTGIQLLCALIVFFTVVSLGELGMQLLPPEGTDQLMGLSISMVLGLQVLLHTIDLELRAARNNAAQHLRRALDAHGGIQASAMATLCLRWIREADSDRRKTEWLAIQLRPISAVGKDANVDLKSVYSRIHQLPAESMASALQGDEFVALMNHPLSTELIRETLSANTHQVEILGRWQGRTRVESLLGQRFR